MKPELLLQDPEIAGIIASEQLRQSHEINLIASENYCSNAVREANASVLTNKYAEGYPNKRYYGGCQYVDQAEQLAIDRCKQLFGAEHVNVQPHAGSPANMTVYAALLQPGDTILGMSLAMGGHLTHGHHVNFSGSWYKSVQYGVNKETELLDYEEIAQLAELHRPKIIVAGASSYSRTIDFEKMSAIAQSVGAYFMADIAHIAGLVAAKLHPSPIPFADCVTSTTHKTLRGPRGGLVMSKQIHKDAIDRAIMPGLQGGPFMHTIAAKAVAFKEAQQADFVNYQQQTIKNAAAMANEFKKLGYRIVADGTDNHMFVIDLRSRGINGKIAEDALAKAGISISRSCVPYDTEKPWITSGIRLGTPAMTTRGMREADIITVAHYINDILQHHAQTNILANIHQEIQILCKGFEAR